MLYLDTEFNGHGGKLISIALVSSTGGEFYGVLPMVEPVNAWVAEHVIPHLARDPEPENELRMRLRFFLEKHSGEDIVADWPDDFAHLLKLMSGPSYEQSFMLPCDMRLLVSGEIEPDVPHNALSDARALMAWHKLSTEAEMATA